MGKNFKLEIIMKNLNKEDKLGKILFYNKHNYIALCFLYWIYKIRNVV